MRVYKNLFGNGSKIHASEIILGDSAENKLLSEQPLSTITVLNGSLTASVTNNAQVVKNNWSKVPVGVFAYYVAGSSYGSAKSFWGTKTSNSYGAMVEISYVNTNIIFHRLVNGAWS